MLGIQDSEQENEGGQCKKLYVWVTNWASESLS